MKRNASSISLHFPVTLRRWCFHLFILCVCAAALTGCAQTKAFKSQSAVDGKVDASVVLLLEPDVQLSLLTAAGLNEPHAEWTELGKKNVIDALNAFMNERNASLIRYKSPRGDPDKAHRHNQIMKMHQAVGVSILNHKYNQMLALPTKADRFDWTLGPETRLLKEEHGADYALFIYLRDSYATAGRAALVAMDTLIGALAALGGFGGGGTIRGGIQLGFASLVDLDTGELVWFNRLISETGDLRTPEPARLAVDSLLTDVPL